MERSLRNCLLLTAAPVGIRFVVASEDVSVLRKEQRFCYALPSWTRKLYCILIMVQNERKTRRVQKCARRPRRTVGFLNVSLENQFFASPEKNRTRFDDRKMSCSMRPPYTHVGGLGIWYFFPQRGQQIFRHQYYPQRTHLVRFFFFKTFCSFLMSKYVHMYMLPPQRFLGFRAI